MDVALSFPLYGLHSIKALEISTPYKKQARSSDPAQAITSDDLTKLHQHRPAHDSDYTHSSSVLGFNKNHSVVVSPLPSLCQVSFCHLFISSSIPLCWAVMQIRIPDFMELHWSYVFFPSSPFLQCCFQSQLWFSLTFHSVCCETKSSRMCLALVHDTAPLTSTPFLKHSALVINLLYKPPAEVCKRVMQNS